MTDHHVYTDTHGTDQNVPAVPGRHRLAGQRVRRAVRQDRRMLADPDIPHRPSAQARVPQVQRRRQRVSRVLRQHARLPEATRSAAGGRPAK